MSKLVIRLFNLMRKGEFAFLLKGITKRIFSKTEAFGLKRDLNIPFNTPSAHITITIRPFKTEDETYFETDLQNDGLIETGISTCYVAVSTENIACCRMWLMDSVDNDKIKEFWGRAFPDLKSDEALIESVFTVPSLRGNGIMPNALELVCQKALEKEKRYTMLFVEVDNTPSLKGSHRAGFSPYVLRTETWWFFKRSIKFEDVPQSFMETYLNDVSV